jgi:transposase
MGPFTMSDKEARRPGLMQAAVAGKITSVEAAQALEMSVRQFRRLKAAYRCRGIEGLLHGNRGRPSPRRRSAQEREQIVNLMLTTYAGLNDCHLTEKLREVEGLELCREAVRQLRQAAAIAPVRRRRAPRHRARRVRDAREGALVLIDGSEFAWLGPEPPVLSLLGAIDDATGRIVALCFRPHEDLHGYTELLRRLIADHGLPCTLYGDRLSVFVRNDDHWSIAEQLAGERCPTQFGQMLADLAIGFIAAHSPQAKGRIERLWQTLQDRLVQELRLRGLTTVSQAEAFLPAFIADFNRRFAHPAREVRPVWRRPPRDLARILGCRYPRRVARDNTVTVPGRWIQIPPGPGGRSWHRARVEVRELLDGRALVLHPDHGILARQPAAPGPFTLAPRDKLERRHALGIDRPRRSRIDDRVPPQLSTPSPKPRLGQLTNIRRPPKSHPWKKLRHPNRLPQLAGRGRT